MSIELNLSMDPWDVEVTERRLVSKHHKGVGLNTTNADLPTTDGRYDTFSIVKMNDQEGNHIGAIALSKITIASVNEIVLLGAALEFDEDWDFPSGLPYTVMHRKQGDKLKPRIQAWQLNQPNQL